MAPDEPITDLDLEAYVDDQLDPARRRAVEAHLAHAPESAARVMGDLSTMHGLRSMLGGATTATPATLAAAHRLERGLRERRRASAWRWAAAMPLIFAVGWAVGHPAAVDSLIEMEAPAPEFVDDAVMSHETALLRARMASQLEVARYDAREIRSAMRITLPDIPSSWRATDVQVFPSDEGPSVGMAFNTQDLGEVSLYAVHAPNRGAIAPTTVRRDDDLVAYWQTGDVAYAVIGPNDRGDLSRTARQLAASLKPDRHS